MASQRRGRVRCDPGMLHTVTWSMVTFSVHDEGEEFRPLPMEELRVRPCHMVELLPTSRKYQPQPRVMPARVNMTMLRTPANGLRDWCQLCMPTILQAWAIANDVDHLSVQERADRAILAPPGAIVRSHAWIFRMLCDGRPGEGMKMKTLLSHIAYARRESRGWPIQRWLLTRICFSGLLVTRISPRQSPM
jgi:hypothetical protein